MLTAEQAALPVSYLLDHATHRDILRHDRRLQLLQAAALPDDRRPEHVRPPSPHFEGSVRAPACGALYSPVAGALGPRAARMRPRIASMYASSPSLAGPTLCPIRAITTSREGMM